MFTVTPVINFSASNFYFSLCLCYFLVDMWTLCVYVLVKWKLQNDFSHACLWFCCPSWNLTNKLNNYPAYLVWTFFVLLQELFECRLQRFIFETKSVSPKESFETSQPYDKLHMTGAWRTFFSVFPELRVRFTSYFYIRSYNMLLLFVMQLCYAPSVCTVLNLTIYHGLWWVSSHRSSWPCHGGLPYKGSVTVCGHTDSSDVYSRAPGDAGRLSLNR